MNTVISVVIGKVNEVNIKGKEYVVNPTFQKLCKKIFRLYVLLMAIVLVVAVNFAPYVGADDIFSVTLFAILADVVYNLIIDFLVRLIIEKKAI